MRALIVYYSLEGNTRLIANAIAEHTDADVLELIPKKEYPTSGFAKYFAGGKSAILKEKPELEKYNANLDNYELIIFGSPIWAGTFAPPLRTFLTEHSGMSNKKIAAFACSSGGGTAKCFTEIKQMLSGCSFVSKLSLIDPLKEYTEKQINDAIEWANSIMK